MSKNNDEQVAQLVADLRTDFTSLAKSNVRILESLATLNQRSQDMKEDVDTLCRIVRDGNGVPPMSTRLTQVEETVRGHGEDLKEVQSACNTLVAAKALTKSQVIAGTVVLLVSAIIGGIVAGITS
jgi:type II secretory pathway component PulF